MEIVYNWHITEHCNYSCDYCFAKWGKPDEVWKNKSRIKTTLNELKRHGGIPFQVTNNSCKIRLNFAGGEPLLLKNHLLPIIQHANDLNFNTSIITNASLLKNQIRIAKHVDMIGISIDSFDTEINRAIGRCTSSGKVLTLTHLSQLICDIRKVNNNIKIKFNVVVNKHNYEEEIIGKLQSLMPYKIKIFKELSAGQNISTTTSFMFNLFIQKNDCSKSNVYIEDNNAMTESYLMIDPKGRLYQNGQQNKYYYSEPIYQVGLVKALNDISFNQNTFMERYEGNNNGH